MDLKPNKGGKRISIEFGRGIQWVGNPKQGHVHLPKIEKAVVCTYSRVPVACLLVRSVNLLAFACKMNCLCSGLSGEQRRLMWHLGKKKKGPFLPACLWEDMACVSRLLFL